MAVRHSTASPKKPACTALLYKCIYIPIPCDIRKGGSSVVRVLSCGTSDTRVYPRGRGGKVGCPNTLPGLCDLCTSHLYPRPPPTGMGGDNDFSKPWYLLQKLIGLQLGCCYYAAIKYVCNNWWRQSSQLERLVACLQQPCSFYQWLQAHRATTRSQLQLVAVTSK